MLCASLIIPCLTHVTSVCITLYLVHFVCVGSVQVALFLAQCVCRFSSCSLLILLQTAKINQGNIALKRVVESIANGDSHVPFRDSKLTMLLQVTFNHVFM